MNFSTILHAVPLRELLDRDPLAEVCDLPTQGDGRPREKCMAILKSLIAARANINPRNSTGLTPLMCACRQKNIEVVKLPPGGFRLGFRWESTKKDPNYNNYKIL